MPRVMKGQSLAFDIGGAAEYMFRLRMERSHVPGSRDCMIRKFECKQFVYRTPNPSTCTFINMNSVDRAPGRLRDGGTHLEITISVNHVDQVGLRNLQDFKVFCSRLKKDMLWCEIIDQISAWMTGRVEWEQDRLRYVEAEAA